MDRSSALTQLKSTPVFDVLIIGGGATGLGVAVDAAARGFRTALVEQHDFAKGTSSRSTKLVHGGVRYLRSGEVGLVRSALHERGLMEKNAPHLVRRQPFVIPVYSTLDKPFYGFGLKIYEMLSGSLSFGPTRILSAEETIQFLPTVVTEGLHGGVVYYDGQFDDARLALTLAQTATDHGAAVINYTRVESLIKETGRVAGAHVIDGETGERFPIHARVVINATGIFTDQIRHLDDAAAAPMMDVSSGVHLVLDKSYLPGDHALMIPKTADGRVLFAVPWHGRVVVGTTDEERSGPELEPKPLEQEIEFLLEHTAKYIAKPLKRSDVLSVFVGLRPLVKKGEGTSSAALSRDHVIVISDAGLVTITGGKWTSYRKMAEDTVDHAIETAGLPAKTCPTADLPLHAAPAFDNGTGADFSPYGTLAAEIEALAQVDPRLAERLHPRLPYRAVEVVWAVQREMARSVEDVLARRTRALLLDARAAIASASAVARLMAHELGKDATWQTAQVTAFTALARGYLL